MNVIKYVQRITLLLCLLYINMAISFLVLKSNDRIYVHRLK